MRKNSFRKLYHFTCLKHLPSILASGGLKRGHIPTMPSLDATIVNLTSIGEKRQQHWYHDYDNIVDKTRIRITVNISEDKLKRWKQIQTEFGIRSKEIKRLDPQGQRRNWFYAFNEVGLDCFKAIQIWQDGQYWHLEVDDAYKLAEVIQEELTKNVVMVNGYLVHNGDDSWLMDGNLIDDPIMLELPMAA